MAPKNILLYGLQRSGTNYVQALLSKNYRVRILNDNRDRSSPLQKHSRFYDNKALIPEPQYENNFSFPTFAEFESFFPVRPDNFLVISKDPYSWFLSYQNWAVNHDWPEVPHHYIEEYNAFYGKFLDFSKATDKIVFVRYLDVIRHSDQVLLKLAEQIGLEKKWLASLMTRRADKVAYSQKFTEEKRNFYIQEEYLEKFTAEQFQSLNRNLDQSVANGLGYELKGI